MRHSKLLCQKANAGVACARREVREREESRICQFRPRRQKSFCQRVNVGMVLRFCRPYIDEKNFYFDTQRLPLPHKGGMGAWPPCPPQALDLLPQQRSIAARLPLRATHFPLSVRGYGALPPCPPKALDLLPHATSPHRPPAPARLPFSSLRKGVWGIAPCSSKSP